MGGVSMEWKEVRLGDILNFRRGHDLPHSAMKPGNIPVAGSNGVIGYHDTATPMKPILTIGRSGNVGKPYFYEEAWAHNTTLYVDDFKGNDPKFLYYLCQTMPFANFGGGSAVPTLNRNHIHPLETKIPVNVEDQRRIASILSSLDRKIELNNKINADLEEMAQAIFKNWFVDFEPFKDGKFVDSELGMIPEGWKVSQIADIPHILETGKRPKGGAVEKGIPSVGAEHVKGMCAYDYSKNKYINCEFAAKLKTGKINGYELMIYKDGGKPGYFIPNFSIFGEGYPFENCYLNEHVFKLDFDGNKGFNIFCYFFFKTEQIMSYFNAQGAKAAIPGINKKDVENIYIFSPDNESVIKFGEFAYPLFKQMLKNAIENRTLSTLRDTLLPRLMSGEIEVPE